MENISVQQNWHLAWRLIRATKNMWFELGIISDSDSINSFIFKASELYQRRNLNERIIKRKPLSKRKLRQIERIMKATRDSEITERDLQSAREFMESQKNKGIPAWL